MLRMTRIAASLRTMQSSGLCLLFLFGTVCGVLACCFFCDSCPLSQYYAETDEGAELYLNTPAQVVQGQPVVYGAVPAPNPKTTVGAVQPGAVSASSPAVGSLAPNNQYQPVLATAVGSPRVQEMETFNEQSSAPAAQKYENSIL